MTVAVRVAFGGSVLRLRTARGWSQQRLASEAGISRSTVGGIEAGARGCSLEAAALIAEALGADLGAMARGEAGLPGAGT